MQVIADYWWIWLIGTLVFVGYGVTRWLLTFVKFAKDVADITAKTHESAQIFIQQDTTRTEKAYQLTGTGINLMRDKIANRARELTYVAISFGIGSVFVILLLIAIVVNIIAYVKT